MRDAFITLLHDAIIRDGYNKEEAAKLTRQYFFNAAPAVPLPNDQNIWIWRARNESDSLLKFLTSGYLNLPVKDPEIKYVVETYSKAFIAYKFVFDMTQTDHLEANLDLMSIVTRGAVKTSVGGSFNGKRRATREFVLADRVDWLLTELPTIRKCNQIRREQHGERPANGAYPIAGKLNLIEVVRNFVAANQTNNLIGQLSDADLLVASSKPPLPTMSETMIFTTTLKGGIAPTLELSDPTHSTGVKGGLLDAHRERLDVHSLTLVMQLPDLKGPTVAHARSEAERKADQSLYGQQANDSAHELNRLEDNRSRKLRGDIIDLIAPE